MDIHSGWYPYTLTLEDGSAVEVELKKFTVSDDIAFTRDWNTMRRIENRDRFVFERALKRLDTVDPATPPAAPSDGADEATMAAHRAAAAAWRHHREQDAIALRDLEETDAEREQRERLAVADDRFGQKFLQVTFTTYVRLVEDGAARPGEVLLARFATKPKVLYRIVGELWVHNRLSADLKKKLSSPSASAPSSDAPIPAASGDGPAPIAAPA